MNAINWKLGMSTCSTGSIDKTTFDNYAVSGIAEMEISLAAQLYPEIDWKGTQKLSADTGVHIWSLHLPFSPFAVNNIATRDNDVRKSTIALQTEYMKKAGDIGIPIAVIHPSGEPNAPEERQELLEYAKDSLAQLADAAAKAGMILAVEDLPRTCLGNCSDEILDLLSADERLRCCFDTNHLLIQKNSDFIKAVNDKIITVHVSDYDFINERHWMPFEGKNDWVEIVTLLEETGYAGPFMYEVGLGTPKTIIRRDLTFQDFKDIYEACVNKRVLPGIGVPNVTA